MCCLHEVCILSLIAHEWINYLEVCVCVCVCLKILRKCDHETENGSGKGKEILTKNPNAFLAIPKRIYYKF